MTKKVLTAFIFIFFVAGFFIYNGTLEYDNHIECEIKELQKLSYKPSMNDEEKIQLYCELEYPYEKQIYGPEIQEWSGQIITINNDNDLYKVTKIKLQIKKCEGNEKDIKTITYSSPDGKNGATLQWNEEYGCYLPNKTEFWGKIQKNSI